MHNPNRKMYRRYVKAKIYIYICIYLPLLLYSSCTTFLFSLGHVYKSVIPRSSIYLNTFLLSKEYLTDSNTLQHPWSWSPWDTGCIKWWNLHLHTDSIPLIGSGHLLYGHYSQPVMGFTFLNA